MEKNYREPLPPQILAAWLPEPEQKDRPWDEKVADDDYSLLLMVIKLADELKHFTKPRVEEDSNDPREFGWRMRREPEQQQYRLQFIYNTNVIFAKHRTDSFIKLDLIHISSFGIEPDYDAKMHRKICNVIVNTHDNKIPIVSREAYRGLFEDSQIVTYQANAAGINVQKTRNGTLVSNMNSPRQSKKRRLE